MDGYKKNEPFQRSVDACVDVYASTDAIAPKKDINKQPTGLQPMWKVYALDLRIMTVSMH